jgi:hypothetical protein
MAATADASTTLAAATIGADDSGRFARGSETELADLVEDLARRRRLLFSDGSLDNREKLALQRPVISVCAPPQSLNHIVGCILDR